MNIELLHFNDLKILFTVRIPRILLALPTISIHFKPTFNKNAARESQRKVAFFDLH